MPEVAKLEAFDLPTKLLRVATSAKHFSLLKISIDMSNNQSILSLFLHVTIFCVRSRKESDTKYSEDPSSSPKPFFRMR